MKRWVDAVEERKEKDAAFYIEKEAVLWNGKVRNLTHCSGG